MISNDLLGTLIRILSPLHPSNVHPSIEGKYSEVPNFSSECV